MSDLKSVGIKCEKLKMGFAWEVLKLMIQIKPQIGKN